MAKNDRRRQQKLMKKRRKDKQRRKARSAIRLSVPALERTRIVESREYPVYECLIGPGWHERGLAHIILARMQPDGNIVAGVYLVDMFCLGLKNTFAHANLSESTYRNRLRDLIRDREGLETCETDLAHTIIYGAIDFAGKFGFRPHPDFELSRHILAERGAFVPREGVEFGKDGKPLYVSGPHDDVGGIVRQLEAFAGEGNFDFVVGGPF